MLGDFRLPSVQKDLRVVVRASEDAPGPLSEAGLEHLRCEEQAAAALFMAGRPYSQPLTMGSVEAVAIFAIVPPSPPPAQQPRGLLQRAWAWLSGLLVTARRRASLLLPTARWGPLVPLWSYLWLGHLGSAFANSKRSCLHDGSFHHLQALCVAKHLRGQGVGSEVMQLIQEHAPRSDGVKGLHGLTHSESTQRFYARMGFASESVLSHRRYQEPGRGPRQHIFLAWRSRAP
jgi:GNAT superfamily N-acetyltransferase